MSPKIRNANQSIEDVAFKYYRGLYTIKNAQNALCFIINEVLHEPYVDVIDFLKGNEKILNDFDVTVGHKGNRVTAIARQRG